MDELEAVNMLLKLIGVHKVNSIGSSQPDVVNARDTLDRIRRKVQIRGWWFNIIYNVNYTPDPITKELTIGNHILGVVFESAYVSKRGTRAFNRLDNTYQFECDVLAYRQVENLAFDLLPEAARNYVAYYAAAEFVRDELEDLKKKKDISIDVGIALIDLKKQELEEGRYNVFNNHRVRNARAGVSPYARNNKRFFGDPDV